MPSGEPARRWPSGDQPVRSTWPRRPTTSASGSDGSATLRAGRRSPAAGTVSASRNTRTSASTAATARLRAAPGRQPRSSWRRIVRAQRVAVGGGGAGQRASRRRRRPARSAPGRGAASAAYIRRSDVRLLEVGHDDGGPCDGGRRDAAGDEIPTVVRAPRTGRRARSDATSAALTARPAGTARRGRRRRRRVPRQAGTGAGASRRRRVGQGRGEQRRWQLVRLVQRDEVRGRCAASSRCVPLATTSGRRPAAIHAPSDADADTSRAGTIGTSTASRAAARSASSRNPVTRARRLAGGGRARSSATRSLVPVARPAEGDDADVGGQPGAGGEHVVVALARVDEPEDADRATARRPRRRPPAAAPAGATTGSGMTCTSRSMPAAASRRRSCSLATTTASQQRGDPPVGGGPAAVPVAAVRRRARRAASRRGARRSRSVDVDEGRRRRPRRWRRTAGR